MMKHPRRRRRYLPATERQRRAMGCYTEGQDPDVRGEEPAIPLPDTRIARREEQRRFRDPGQMTLIDWARSYGELPVDVAMDLMSNGWAD